MQQNIGLEDNQIIRKVNIFDGDPGVVEGVIRDCIADGANVIFTTSFGYMAVCEKLSVEFPRVIFIQAMGNKNNNSNFTYYTTKLYQARYLSGIVAGLTTKTNQIGYVAALGTENSEVTGGINAFAMGIESVNPAARVYVRVTHNWFDPMGEADAANALIETGCDIIAAHSDTSNPQLTAQRAGVLAIGFNIDMLANAPDTIITSVIPYWGKIYTRCMETIIKGTFKAGPNFCGLKEDAVGISVINEQFSSPKILEAVETAKQRIIQGNFNVFDGVLETNDGRLVGEEGQTLSDSVILDGINWYYRNVVVMK